jgi:hypothetical protein
MKSPQFLHCAYQRRLPLGYPQSTKGTYVHMHDCNRGPRGDNGADGPRIIYHATLRPFSYEQQSIDGMWLFGWAWDLSGSCLRLPQCLPITVPDYEVARE